MIQSKLVDEEMDYRWASIYVALTNTRDRVIGKGLANIIPSRRKNNGKNPRGTPPTVFIDEKEERWLWQRQPNKYSEEDKRKILGEVVESVITASFSNHFYKWNNKVKRQRKETSKEIILDISDDLISMRYPVDWIETVLKSSLIGWMRWIQKAEEKGASWNRKEIDNLDTKRFKKILGNQEWYREEI